MSQYFDVVIEQLKRIDEAQNENIDKAAELISQSLISGGILQAFGSGHSYAGAIEIVERAGGLFATKLIKDPSLGIYETVEGVGEILMRKVEICPEDVVMIISFSGRNPLGIEVAQAVKRQGAKLIAVTSLEESKKLKSRHSSGLRLFELADVTLDCMGVEGDAAINIEPLPNKICATSSIANAALIQATILSTVEKLIQKGVKPDIRISANLDHGTIHNLELQKKYAHRIFRI